MKIDGPLTASSRAVQANAMCARVSVINRSSERGTNGGRRRTVKLVSVSQEEARPSPQTIYGVVSDHKQKYILLAIVKNIRFQLLALPEL